MPTGLLVEHRQSAAAPSAPTICRPDVRPAIVSIVIADAHALFREALRELLDDQPDFEVVGDAGDGRSFVDLVRAARPAVALLDLHMPGMSGLDALAELSQTAPDVHTLIVASDASDDEVVEALHRGARGVVMKHGATEHLFKSIRMVVAGQYWVGRDTVGGLIARMQRKADPTASDRAPNYGFTARELQLVAAVVDGCTNNDIALQLQISQKTVKHHLTKIFAKAGVSNRLELALFAVQHQFRHGRFHA